MAVDLTIFVPTYNRPLLLKACMSAIKKSLISCGISYEILVVNESPITLILNEENVTVFNFEKEILPCDAMYFALLNSTGKYFMRIDDDNEVYSDLVSKLYRYIETHKDVAYCGALALKEDGSVSNPGTIFSKYLKLSLRNMDIIKEDYEVDVVDNVYIMNPKLISLEVFLQSCKFFPWTFEDGYDQLRLKKINYRVVVLASANTIHHGHGGSINFKQIYNYGRSKFILYRCIFKFSYAKAILLSAMGLLYLLNVFGLLYLISMPKNNSKNIRKLLLVYRYYLNGTKDGLKFAKDHKLPLI